MSEEQQKTTEEFIEEYGKLREKYKRDFIAVPTYAPNKNGEWTTFVNIQVMDITPQLVKSPFIPEN